MLIVFFLSWSNKTYQCPLSGSFHRNVRGWQLRSTCSRRLLACCTRTSIKLTNCPILSSDRRSVGGSFDDDPASRYRDPGLGCSKRGNIKSQNCAINRFFALFSSTGWYFRERNVLLWKSKCPLKEVTAANVEWHATPSLNWIYSLMWSSKKH